MAKIGLLAVVVLELLTEAPRHPYDIANTMHRRHMDEHVKLSMGSLYHVVEQLVRLGWIRSTGTVRAGRRPERTIYEVTVQGMQQLRDRTRQLIAEPISEHGAFEIGVAFMHRLPKEEAAALLRHRADALREQVECGNRPLDGHPAGGRSGPSVVAEELVRETRRFQVDWALRIAGQIDSGALAWDHPATHTDAVRDPDASRHALEVRQ